MVLIATLATVGEVSGVCNVLDISQLRAADISYVEVDRRGISRAWPIKAPLYPQAPMGSRSSERAVFRWSTTPTAPGLIVRPAFIVTKYWATKLPALVPCYAGYAGDYRRWADSDESRCCMIQQPQTTEPPDQEASIKSAPICPSHQLPMDDPFGYGAGRKVFMCRRCRAMQFFEVVGGETRRRDG